jgi:murein DD-endopeptidase MepM/ murein hydrolase activator NlpD
MPNFKPIALREKMNQQRKTIAISAKILFLLALALVILTSLLPKHDLVRAEAKYQLASTSGGWLSASFPVENFQAYTSPFGYRRSATGGSGTEFHSGLDIAAPNGSYVRNWWAGRVIKVGDNGACGSHITIESGQWQHTYCHMQGNIESFNGVRYFTDRSAGIQIAQGQDLPAGVRIGRVGMTGRTTGPHLHWGLKYAGNYVDPAMVLRAMYSQQQAYRGGKPLAGLTPQQSAVTIQESKYIKDSGY